MKPDVRIVTSIAEVDRGEWDRLSADRPFASYNWYQFGESVLAPAPRWYVLVYDAGELIARATFWLSRQEQLPLSSAAERLTASLFFRFRPLLLCRSPLADWSGLILPQDSRRAEALRLISMAIVELAAKQRVSFTAFDYLDLPAMHEDWQGLSFLRVDIDDPGTCLTFGQSNFAEYLHGLPKSAYKDYRRHRNQAAARRIEVTVQDRVSDLEEALALVRAVEKRHQSMPKPWARALLEQASGGNTAWLSARQDGRLVGCGLILNDNRVHLATLLGLDYRVEYVYFQLMYAAIENAIAHQARALRGGSGAYPFKEHLGFTLEDNNHLTFSSQGPILQRLGLMLGRP
ncbi:uncharacterized protein conserved in bacteria [Longilinea arvoryzae]|uniref:Uncharacterized protein conserved in bacteria n=1 Tax=Longilinea arvoryzae TaxID=360412 RepID=A0A0S7BHE4_9CHLR|nr:GNAT family N-acetyltransferase [Longilinea arvoryzae]GAP15069.1 uncharacterized protein conserved in bacteria [Longilinea arvoryzae]